MVMASKRKKAVAFVFSILPFTRTFQLKWKAFFFFFPFTLGVLIEFLVTLSPFNSEYQLLKFSDNGALFSCGMQWIPR